MKVPYALAFGGGGTVVWGAYQVLYAQQMELRLSGLMLFLYGVATIFVGAAILYSESWESSID